MMKSTARGRPLSRAICRGFRCDARRSRRIAVIHIQQSCFSRRAAPSRKADDPQNAHRTVDRDGQHIPDPQLRMWFDGRLPIDPNRAFGNQIGAVRASLHDPGTPQPHVQPLPIAVFRILYREPPCRKAASAANGPEDTVTGGGGSATGRRRRCGISIGGAGGPW